MLHSYDANIRLYCWVGAMWGSQMWVALDLKVLTLLVPNHSSAIGISVWCGPFGHKMQWTTASDQSNILITFFLMCVGCDV